MTSNLNTNSSYISASKKVKSIRAFYFSLIFFLLVVSFTLIFKPFSNAFVSEKVYIWFDSTIFVIWAIALVIHGWSVFGRRLLFKKSWEDRKIKEFLEDEKEEKTWEQDSVQRYYTQLIRMVSYRYRCACHDLWYYGAFQKKGYNQSQKTWLHLCCQYAIA